MTMKLKIKKSLLKKVKPQKKEKDKKRNKKLKSNQNQRKFRRLPQNQLLLNKSHKL